MAALHSVDALILLFSFTVTTAVFIYSMYLNVLLLWSNKSSILLHQSSAWNGFSVVFTVLSCTNTGVTFVCNIRRNRSEVYLYALTLQRSSLLHLLVLFHGSYGDPLNMNPCSFAYLIIQLNYSSANALWLPAYLTADCVAYSVFIGHYTSAPHCVYSCKLYHNAHSLILHHGSQEQRLGMKVNIWVWARILGYDPSMVCFDKQEEGGGCKINIQSENKMLRMQFEVSESETEYPCTDLSVISSPCRHWSSYLQKQNWICVLLLGCLLLFFGIFHLIFIPLVRMEVR